MLGRVKERVWGHFTRRYLFNPGVQEALWREAFFYSAFRALAFNGISGDYAEFGSWGGRTFALAHRESRRHGLAVTLWAFDSFQGLPPQQGTEDVHPAWQHGAMATSVDEFHAICAANGIPRADYRAVPGFYEATLAARQPTDEPRDIALAYVDCDLYSSTKTVLEFLAPRMKHGMIIAFDDYFCWSATQISGERRAQLECFPPDGRWELIPYVQYGWAGHSFVVEDRRLRSA